MKWCSLLDQEDLTEMKQLHKNAIDNNIDTITFNNVEYKTKYVESVISYIEDFGLNNNINNHREADDLIY
tara:strand:+ start:2309 stop:2518 length:210 start_codon:yes stop_codon:yes gene_type:complete